MRMRNFINASLLRFIAEEGTITLEELKRKYLVPEQAGVVQGERVMLEENLRILEIEGYITIENDVITYIGN